MPVDGVLTRSGRPSLTGNAETEKSYENRVILTGVDGKARSAGLDSIARVCIQVALMVMQARGLPRGRWGE